MRVLPFIRTLQVIFSLVVLASAIEIIDQSGVTSDESVVADAAQAIRSVRTTEMSIARFEGLVDVDDTVRSILNAFDDVAVPLAAIG